MRTTTMLSALLLVSTLPASSDQGVYSKSVVAKPLLRTATTSSGAPLSLPARLGEVGGIEVTIPAGSSTGWHVHDRSGFAYVMAGTLRVTLQDSSSHTYKAGDALAEVVGTPHEGSALGKEDVRLVAFFLADSGQPLSRKVESPR